MKRANLRRKWSTTISNTAENLSKAGWSWDGVSAIDSHGRTIFVADAHRDDGKRFVVRADEKLTAFLELESDGALALLYNLEGSANTATGAAALSNTTGSNNVALGSGAGLSATSGSGNVYIGAGMQGVAGESDACYIRSIFSRTSASGIPVLINSSNKLGTTTSSKRFKEDIKPMDRASEAILALKPVTLRYKKEIDPAGTSQFGLVAEEVEKVNPDLVVRDKEGRPYSVRYDQVNAMLLNEFLKEHRKVEEQEATIAQQKRDSKLRSRSSERKFRLSQQR